MDIKEKAAFLKGLVEGSDLQLGEKEKKIMDAVLDLLSSMAQKVSEVDADVSDLYDGFESVSDSIDEIEEDLDYLFERGGEDGAGGEDEEESLYDVECPKCHEVICIDEDMLVEGDIACPNCGEILEFDISCDCDECKEAEEN